MERGCKHDTCSSYALTLRAAETYFTRAAGHRGKKVASITPVAGKALLHLHGDECLEHEGTAVSKGTKYILRSDVVFG